MTVWEGQSSVQERIWLFRERQVFEDQVVMNATPKRNSVSMAKYEAILLIMNSQPT